MGYVIGENAAPRFNRFNLGLLIRDKIVIHSMSTLLPRPPQAWIIRGILIHRFGLSLLQPIQSLLLMFIPTKSTPQNNRSIQWSENTFRRLFFGEFCFGSHDFIKHRINITLNFLGRPRNILKSRRLKHASFQSLELDIIMRILISRSLIILQRLL